MPKDQLQELFRQKKEKAKPANIDWAAKRDAWIKAVNALYHTIADEYLGAAKNDVEITLNQVEAAEKYVGGYRIPQLVLKVGDEQVFFTPVGINVVGAQGRIDVHGDRGTATIIWRGDGDWSIVVSRAPKLRVVPLSADSLAEMLAGIMRP
jgi:hypothetical protein